MEIVFVIILVMLSFLCGLASALIAFSGWVVMVPLLLPSMPLFSSLMLSLMLDCFNGAAVSIFYTTSRHRKHVLVLYGWLLPVTLLGIATAVPLAVVAVDVLPEYENMLRGGVAYVNLVICLFFFIRGLTQRYKNKVQGDHGSVKAGNTNMQESTPSSPLLTKTKAWGGDSHMPIYCSLSGVALLLCSVLFGGIGGLLGLGSGTNYTIVLLLLCSWRMPYAIAGGCHIMALISLAVLLTYGCKAQQLESVAFTLSYLKFMLPPSALGVWAGNTLAQSLMPWKLSMVIAAAMLVVSIYKTSSYIYVADSKLPAAI